MAATGCTSCQDPLEGVPCQIWRTAATSAESGSHSPITRGTTFIPSMGTKVPARKEKGEHDGKAKSLHSVGATHQHAHQHPEPRESQESQHHGTGELQPACEVQVWAPSEAETDGDHYRYPEDLLDYLPDDLSSDHREPRHRKRAEPVGHSSREIGHSRRARPDGEAQRELQRQFRQTNQQRHQSRNWTRREPGSGRTI